MCLTEDGIFFCTNIIKKNFEKKENIINNSIV